MKFYLQIFINYPHQIKVNNMANSIYKLTEINIYPIKSCGQISLQSAKIEERGLQYDRRWMVVDENKMFMTQRHFPEMAFIKVRVEENGLLISHAQNKLEQLFLPYQSNGGERIDVVVWNDTAPALNLKKETCEWFSEALNIKCNLAFMDDYSIRHVDNMYAKNNEIVSFADGYPFLIIGEESLKLLNSKLEKEIPMHRFRPNLVFTGGEPHDEDKWSKIKIGQNIFYVAKPCARCVVTTIDQSTAAKNKEPLKTLSTYRLEDNKVLFGQNLLQEKSGGVISVGDKIIVEK